ncbi:DUF3108 domain-containing protein [Ramlibacter sp. AW1]|uniref:DUF3108 domain-containing protein n=1 Tax=Ramlibacter aurantiacus TaxID=2801330 RepID=A0A936ZUV4_9BURK|nr:DUF3108 domain-containing protein [Ramlibacter aurantiacus]MBL0421575.1 DUF3108 domain-containing protein [Ramlibacter aurantiacus]
MAGRTGLKGTRSRPARLPVVVLAVLLLHVAGLEWLARHRPQASALKTLDEPLFTRVLVPEAPPPPGPSASMVATAPAAPERPVLRSIEPQVAQVEPKPDPRPEPEPKPEPPPAPGPEPEPEATPPAPEPQAPASADEPVAQAPEPVADATPATQPAVDPTAEPAPPSEPAPAASAEPANAGSDPAALDRWPRDSRLSYALTGQYRGGPLYGSAQVQWQREGSTYQARVTLDISLAGTRVMTSQGEVRPDGLVPEVYEETRRGNRRAVQMERERLVFDNGSTAPRPPSVQDTASQFVELGHRFASGRERLELGGSVQIWLARPNAADLWTYDIVESTLLQTPRHGEVEAFRLVPRALPKPRGNITAEIWIAPALQYLPVRIRVSMGDEAFVDLMVDTIEQR